jgi:hypothetical protein
VCLLHGISWVFTRDYVASIETVSSGPLTTVVTDPIPDQYVLDRWWQWDWCLSEHLGSPRQYHSTSAPYSSSFACCSYQKEKREKSENFAKALSEVWEHWIEKYFHFCVSKGSMRKDCTPSDEGLPAGHDEEIPQLPELKKEISKRLVTMTLSQNAIHRNTLVSKKWPFYCVSLLLCWVRGSEPKWHRNRDTKGGQYETWKRNYEKWPPPFPVLKNIKHWTICGFLLIFLTYK